VLGFNLLGGIPVADTNFVGAEGSSGGPILNLRGQVSGSLKSVRCSRPIPTDATVPVREEDELVGKLLEIFFRRPGIGASRRYLRAGCARRQCANGLVRAGLEEQRVRTRGSSLRAPRAAR
jgi:hypothetical protein